MAEEYENRDLLSRKRPHIQNQNILRHRLSEGYELVVNHELDSQRRATQKK
jgi:hypothetical protein